MIPFYEQKADYLQIEAENMKDFPPHLHLDIELLYIQKGRIAAQIEEEEYMVEEGRLLLVAPNLVHSYRVLSPAVQTKDILIIGQPSLAGDYQNRLLTSRPTCPLVEAERLHPDVFYALAALRDGGKNQEGPEVLKLFFQLILARVFPLLQWENTEDGLPHSLAAQVIRYMSEHYREELSLDTLAATFGVSRYHLSRLFSRTIHTGFYPYLHSLRINYAKGLLQNTGQDILSIALDCGFENQQTFNRVFKSLCGMTPKEYRRCSFGA